MADLYKVSDEDRRARCKLTLAHSKIIRWPELEPIPDLPPEKPILNKWEDLPWFYQGKMSPLLNFDCFIRPWVYFESPILAVSWFVPMGFNIGSIFVLVAIISYMVPLVFNGAAYDSFSDKYDWLSTFPNFFGTSLWSFATLLQICESVNFDLPSCEHEWQVNGQPGPKPKYKWIGIELLNGAWWGGVLYTVGCYFFMVALAMTVAIDFPSITFSDEVLDWTIYYFFLMGSVLFLMAGAAITAKVISRNMWSGILPPQSRAQATSLIWNYFWGGVSYGMNGICYYWLSPSHPDLTALNTQQWIFAFGFLLGTFFYYVGSLLYLIRIARNKCNPGFVGVGRLDATVEGGNEFGRMSQQVGGRMSRFSMVADDASHAGKFSAPPPGRDDSAHGSYGGDGSKYKPIARDDSAHGGPESKLDKMSHDRAMDKLDATI